MYRFKKFGFIFISLCFFGLNHIQYAQACLSICNNSLAQARRVCYGEINTCLSLQIDNSGMTWYFQPLSFNKSLGSFIQPNNATFYPILTDGKSATLTINSVKTCDIGSSAFSAYETLGQRRTAHFDIYAYGNLKISLYIK
jgi:hypothetical protein